MIGIYKITNLVNQKSYIGQSVNIDKRLKEHINDAFNPNRKEYNYPLSRAYRKYGVENFSKEVLCICSKEELNKKEEYYIKIFNSKENGYNQQDGGQPKNRPLGEKHYRTKLTDEQVFLVREEYNNHTSFEEVFDKYSNGMSISGFRKIWHGYSRTNIHMDVYTKENKEYWEYLKNISGNRLFSDKDIIDIRTRLKNGESQDSIYQDYKGKAVKKESFNDICSGKRYTHIIV